MKDEEFDYYFLEETMEKESNIQCIFCAGWALYCDCKNGYFDDELKKEIKRYLVTINRGNDN